MARKQVTHLWETTNVYKILFRKHNRKYYLRQQGIKWWINLELIETIFEELNWVRTKSDAGLL
jgi:hypothetical protein